MVDADRALALRAEPSSTVSALTRFDHGEGRSIETAPKDEPILAWCSEECNDPECGYSATRIDERCTSLCLYHANRDALSGVGDGFAIVELGGGFDDSTWEYPNQAWMPDAWFRMGSEFEEAANPVLWWPLPAIVDRTPKVEA